MASEGTKYPHKQYLFTGEWIADLDPLKLGEANYEVLRNCRYTDAGLEGVLGYSKINTTALAGFLKGRAGIQLASPYSGQSRVLVQMKNAAETGSRILENKTAIPNQGDFEAATLHSDAAGAGPGRFGKWPGGHIVYCNGKESLVYAGNEMRCAGCRVYAPDGSFNYNFTSVIQNMETDSANVATLHRVSEAVDADTLLLLHLDDNVTDSSPATPHTVTNTNGTFATSPKKFGTHALRLNGTDAYLSIPDDADFDFSGGTFTIDCWVRLAALPTGTNRFALYQHETAGTGNDWFEFYIDANGAVRARVRADHGGAPAYDVTMATTNNRIVAGQYYHIALVESGDDWWIFIDGVKKAYVSSANRCANYTGSVLIGYNGDGAGNYLDGYIDEFRVSNAARYTAYFEPPSSAYGASAYRTYFYVGSTRPLTAIKGYVGTANTTAGALNVEYWNGSGWAGVTSLVDGTALLGVPLAQTGIISFSSTVSTAKVKAIGAVVLYWYRVTVTECDATTTLYHISVDAPMQPVKDLWDGIYRTAIAFLVYDGSTYEDYTTNVAEEDYSSVNSATIAPLDALDAANHVVMGFQHPIIGVSVTVVGKAANANAAMLDVQYWNGSAWVSVGSVEDGTLKENASLGQSGTITWNPVEHNTEFPTEISKRGELYYYKFQWSATLSATVSIDYIGGITAPRKLSGGYKFGFMFQGHPMLCCFEAGKEGNRVDYGQAYTTEVHNGDDTSYGYGGPIYFGGNEELTAACEIFNRFGAQIYNVAVMCKASETHLLDGQGPGSWRAYQINSIIGCPAPATMDTAAIAWGMEGDATRNIALWLSHSGPVVFDAGVLSVYRPRISNYFDQTRTDAIDLTKIGESVGWTDAQYHEYNLIIPLKTGARKWLCLDLIRKRWFEKYPQAAAEPYPWAAFRVCGSNGITYVYALRDNGHMMRLEHGTTWDGVGITQTVKTGRQALTGDVKDVTEIKDFKFVVKGVAEADVNVTVNHYKNDESTATKVREFSATGSGYLRRVQPGGKLYLAWAHQVEFIVTTSDTEKGVALLGYRMDYEKLREETRDA